MKYSLLSSASFLVSASLLALLGSVACAPGTGADAGEGGDDDEGGDGDGDGDIIIGDGDGDGVIIPGGTAWPGPESPVIDEGAPADVASLFSGASAGANCVLEPQDGTMMPKNWLRPRFRVSGAAVAYQVTLSSSESPKDLVGYGGPEGFRLPVEYWNYIASRASSNPVAITATVRSFDGAAVSESVVTLNVAPVTAGGAMVYWASKESKDHVNSSKLYGFSVGEDGVVEALAPLDVAGTALRDEIGVLKPNTATEWRDASGAAAGAPSCIGCHTSTPDGAAVAFNDGWPWDGVVASIEEGTKGQRPSTITDMGAALLATPFTGTLAFSAGHWSEGDRKAISTYTPWINGPYEGGRNITTAADLVWIDVAAPGDGVIGTDGTTANTAFIGLQGTGWNYISRGTDTRAAANPAWNDVGDTIAYASVARVAGGHVGGITGSAVPKSPDTVLTDATEADIYTVPFNGGAGGEATPVSGASVPGVAEYYPDFSPDGGWLAFNRAGSTLGYIYYRPDGEVNVIPTAGGEPHRLVANDPPACTGQTSPGVINSWPKWGPSVETASGNTYRWIIFSSARTYPGSFEVPRDYYTPSSLDTRSSQLYLAAVVEAPDGTLTSYPGLYIWNQTSDTSNLTPAWDEFKIPPVTVR